MTFMNARKYLWLFAIILSVLILRIYIFEYVYSNYPSHIQTPDSPGYISAARSLVQGHLATMDTARTPGFPAFIALVFSFFGPQLGAVDIAQILISGINIFLTFILANKLFKSSLVGMAAVLFYAIDLPTFYTAQLILTETIFTTTLLIAVMAGIYWLDHDSSKPGWLYAFLFAFCLGVATLVRPITYYFIFIVIAAWIAGAIIRKYSTRKIILTITCLSIGFFIPVGGWQVHNYWLTRCLDFNSIEGVNLYLYRGAGIIALRDHIPLADAKNEILKEYPFPPTTGPGCGPEKKLAFQVFQKYPLLLAAEFWDGFRNVLLDSNGGDFILYLNLYYPHSPLDELGKVPLSSLVNEWLIENPFSFVVFLYAKIYLVVIYMFACIPLLKLIPFNKVRINPALLLTFGLVAYLVLISSGPEGYARFRVPVMPFISMVAGFGAFKLWKRCASLKILAFINSTFAAPGQLNSQPMMTHYWKKRTIQVYGRYDSSLAAGENQTIRPSTASREHL